MRAVELFSVAAFLGLLAFSFSNLAAPAWFLPVALLLGWLAADLFSGLAHWALDSFGSVRTPVLGPAFIRPFREHHADPESMTRHDFIEVNGASCVGCLPVLACAALVPMNPYVHTVLVCFSLGILLTNQCHKWAHSGRPPAFARALQRLGLILSSREHIKHHTPPFDTHFCTASGWLNRPLDALLKRAR